MTAGPHRHVLVIGAQRCGTTYLGAALDAHPHITMARPARPEPKVFCDPELAARGADWYHRTWFSHAVDEQVLGDKSTSYLEDPAAPARAADMLGGEVHVVVVLREPVQRAVSNWRFSSRNGLETRPVEDALRADLEGGQPWDEQATSVSPFAYLRRGRYADFLAPWWSTFAGTTHLLLMEEMLAGPEVLTGLVGALGVDPRLLPPPAPHPVNASEGDRPVLSNGLRGTLEEYFEESNDALRALTGRALPW
jgi:hypothetical protein